MKKIILVFFAMIASLLSNGQPFPDNVLESRCNRPLEGSAWEIQRLASSPDEEAASYSPVLVGDIDGNGVCDIVVAKYNGNNYRSREINVYSGLDLSLQYSFTVPDTIYLSNGPYAIGRYLLSDGSMQGAIFTHCYDKRIRAYAIDGTLLNVSDQPTSCDGMVSLADFNGDGYPEVYAGSDIYDAATLKWLCSGPSNGNKGLSHRGTPSYSNGVYHHTYYAMSLAYNSLGNEKQELICGNTIYDVNIVSRTNPSLNSVTVNKTITPPNGCSQDGHVCIADFDLDGETEILVIRDDTDDQHVDNTYFYAYKPSNGQIIFQKPHNCASTSYVFIGNIDTDPYPEIVLLENQPNGSTEKIFCWRYTPQNGFNTVWSQNHDDRSGQTAMTLFDFNQDNIMELVYRDNNNLRIINASGKSHITGNDTIKLYNLYTRKMAAGTGCEYPVVADVNGDGAAEIVATGLLDQHLSYDVGYGGVHIFGSPSSWSSARPVWNQYMYHVTNVNEDLTTPTFCFEKATAFTALDGTIRRPFNNFLQQAGYIDQHGEPYNPGGTTNIDIQGSGCLSFTYNGIEYTESGLFEQLIESPDGCDTLYNIEVSIGALTYEWWQQACTSYTWNGITYTAPGDYTQEFIAHEGCDSIVTLHLSFDIYPESIPAIYGPTEVYVTTDILWGEYHYFIEPVGLAEHYEWELDGAEWSIDTLGTDCTLTISHPGTATLRVRAWNGCGFSEQEIVIHAGFFDINDFQTISAALYPNPAHDKVTIEAESIVRIKLYNLQGQCVWDYPVNQVDHVELPLPSLPPSLYLVEIQTAYGIARTKLKTEPL